MSEEQASKQAMSDMDKEPVRVGLRSDVDLALGYFVQNNSRRMTPDAIKAQCDEFVRLKVKLGLPFWILAVLAGREMRTVRLWQFGYRVPPTGFLDALRDESQNHPARFNQRIRAIVQKYGRGRTGYANVRRRLLRARVKEIAGPEASQAPALEHEPG